MKKRNWDMVFCFWVGILLLMLPVVYIFFDGPYETMWTYLMQGVGALFMGAYIIMALSRLDSDPSNWWEDVHVMD